MSSGDPTATAARRAWRWITADDDPSVARVVWRLMMVLLVLAVVLYAAL